MKPLGRSHPLATLAVSCTVAACTVGVAAIVGSTVTAAPAIDTVATTDVAGSVRDLAEQAIDQIAQEQSLVEQVTATTDPSQIATIGGRLGAVDAGGVGVLEQLDRLDVALTQAARIALGPLPEGQAFDPAVLPQPVVYEAASADLRRIAATPAAVTNAPVSSNGPSFGLLAVAAFALLALGAAALGNSLRRRPPADDADLAVWSDRLTGLGNRRRLDADLDLLDGTDRPTALIAVDIDRFDEISIEFGAAVGDEVVCLVGDTLSHEVRQGDVVYRCDRGSFCLLLPGASDADAHEIAERITRSIGEIGLPDGGPVSVTVDVARAEVATGAIRSTDDASAAS